MKLFHFILIVSGCLNSFLFISFTGTVSTEIQKISCEDCIYRYLRTIQVRFLFGFEEYKAINAFLAFRSSKTNAYRIMKAESLICHLYTFLLSTQLFISNLCKVKPLVLSYIYFSLLQLVFSFVWR